MSHLGVLMPMIYVLLSLIFKRLPKVKELSFCTNTLLSLKNQMVYLRFTTIFMFVSIYLVCKIEQNFQIVSIKEQIGSSIVEK